MLFISIGIIEVPYLVEGEKLKTIEVVDEFTNTSKAAKYSSSFTTAIIFWGAEDALIMS